MEVAPTILPPRLDVCRGCAAERVPEALFAAGVRVRDELGRPAAVDLLEAAGEQLEHDGARRLDPLGRDLDAHAAEAAQRKALFSFSKKPSSWR